MDILNGLEVEQSDSPLPPVPVGRWAVPSLTTRVGNRLCASHGTWREEPRVFGVSGADNCDLEDGDNSEKGWMEAM